jgi:branched-chain amino acid transport system ATP-binding protein
MNDLLDVRRLSKSYGGLTTNDDISFRLGTGDRVALIGPNGAGKTTLVNLITGITRPTSGQVLLDGEDITGVDVATRVGRGLVRTFQTTRLFNHLTVADNIALAVMQQNGMSRRVFSRATERPDVCAVWMRHLEVLNIAHLAYRPVWEIAYGQQRLVEMAIGLALNPKVLLLDEPAAGVPHDEAPRILEAIGKLPSDIAILMIEHDMDLVFQFAKRVLVLAAGKLICEGTPAEVTANHDVRRAYLGSYADARQSA